MTSPPAGRIAADTNVLLSAAVNGAARRVFRAESGLDVVTTASNLVELKRHLPDFIQRYRLDPDEVAEQLAALPLRVYGEAHYRSHLERARSFLERRDPDDVALLALALRLQIPIWSNDRDFSDVPLHVYPTARLLKILGL